MHTKFNVHDLAAPKEGRLKLLKAFDWSFAKQESIISIIAIISQGCFWISVSMGAPSDAHYVNSVCIKSDARYN